MEEGNVYKMWTFISNVCSIKGILMQFSILRSQKLTMRGKTNVKCVNIQNHRSKGKLSFCYISTINTRNVSGYMCALRVFIDVFGEEKESVVIH